MHPDIIKRAAKFFEANKEAQAVHFVLDKTFTSLPVAIAYQRSVKAVKVSSFLRAEVVSKNTNSKSNDNSIRKSGSGRRIAPKVK